MLLILRALVMKIECQVVDLQEMSTALKATLEVGLELLLPPLVQRAGEVSNAGRETFLAATADATIKCFSAHMTPSKVCNKPPLPFTLHCRIKPLVALTHINSDFPPPCTHRGGVRG